MRRIVNSEEMKYCDQNTISHFGVPSLVLMERAALGVADAVPKNLSNKTILIVCGSGNNGADGLAAARILSQRGYTVTAVQMPDNGKRTEENRLQREILDRYGIPVLQDMPDTVPFGCVIDAVFGIGLSRAPQGKYAEWIQAMNVSGGYKIAVDMPSGVSSDTGEVYEAAFLADVTVTFAYEKAGQMLHPGCGKCGKVLVLDIGITDESWLERRPSCFAPEIGDLSKIPRRPSRSNKGTFGRLLVIAGSKNMAGAALFCAKAAYCTGCGLVKIHTPEENRTILQTALPEAVLSVYDEKRGRQEQDLLEQDLQWADVVAIGPGIGTGKTARRIVEQTLWQARVPVVADADALNILAQNPQILKEKNKDNNKESNKECRKAELAITPHLGEMARLCGKDIAQIQQSMQKTAQEYAKQNRLVCVLKDAVTVTAGRAAVYFNTSGTPALAKGGSGDVLTGMIAALAAQGMPLEEAAFMGVYLHGLAGEYAARKKGAYSVLARDIIDSVGKVLTVP